MGKRNVGLKRKIKST